MVEFILEQPCVRAPREANRDALACFRNEGIPGAEVKRRQVRAAHAFAGRAGQVGWRLIPGSGGAKA